MVVEVWRGYGMGRNDGDMIGGIEEGAWNREEEGETAENTYILSFFQNT